MHVVRSRARLKLRETGVQMFYALACGFVGFTGLLCTFVLYMAYEHRAVEAKAAQALKQASLREPVL